MTWEEYESRVARGELRTGERIQRLDERDQAEGHFLYHFEQVWKQHVDGQIRRYEFDDEQAQKARAILSHCLEQGRGLIAKRAAEIERIRAAIGRILDSSGERSAAQLKEIETAKARMKSLLQPLDEIFEEQLVPRVDRLATDAQRSRRTDPRAP